VLLLDNEFIKPILTLTKTLTGNLQRSNGPFLRSSLSRKVSYTSKENYENNK